MSEMTITPIDGKVFGATVTDVSLPKLTDTEFAEIHQAFLQYGFLVFPEQFLTAEQNIAFGERFGPLEFGALPLANQKRPAGRYLRWPGARPRLADNAKQRRQRNLAHRLDLQTSQQ